MNHAKLENSPRLKRVHGLLSDGRWHSTREIIQAADVCAVNSIVCELRNNGFEIECRQRKRANARPVWEYQMRTGEAQLEIAL